MEEARPLELLISPPLGYLLAAVWGALWGSFANVAIHRLGREDASLRSLVHPPSHCPKCLTPIRARDNVPILGFLLLGGRCRACRAPIPIRYPLVELLGVLLALAVYHEFVAGRTAPAPLALCRFFVDFGFVLTLVVLAAIDLDTMLLPEAITIPAIPAFFLAGRVLHEVPLVDAAIGAVVGFGALKALQLGYAAATGREGLGGGDAMLLALVGGFLGWRALPFTLGLGATFGTLVSVPLLLWQRRHPRPPAPDAAEPAAAEVPLRHVEIPFGPFLVAGALTYFFLAPLLHNWLLAWAERP